MCHIRFSPRKFSPYGPMSSASACSSVRRVTWIIKGCWLKWDKGLAEVKWCCQVGNKENLFFFFFTKNMHKTCPSFGRCGCFPACCFVLSPWWLIHDIALMEFAPSAAKLSKVLQLSVLPLCSMSMDGWGRVRLKIELRNGVSEWVTATVDDAKLREGFLFSFWVCWSLRLSVCIQCGSECGSVSEACRLEGDTSSVWRRSTTMGTSSEGHSESWTWSKTK